MTKLLFVFFSILLSFPSYASGAGTIDLTSSIFGISALVIFSIAYLLVIGEEFIHLRKSKPVLVAAGIIWLMIGYIYTQHGISEQAEEAFNHNLLEYAQLLLFLLVAMTYINAMEERGIFENLRIWMVSKGLSLRSLFWTTGILAFAISSFANNLTTAMLMCAIILKVAPNNVKFINIACINIVVASNAGGVFSPFGDITTLMIWQAGLLQFQQFFVLLIPSLVNFIIPALIMSLFISNDKSTPIFDNEFQLKRGAKRIVTLFVLTIITAVLCHSLIQMPPVLGMMLGLGYLKFLGFYLRKSLPRSLNKKRTKAQINKDEKALKRLGNIVPFDIFDKVARAEWDTLLFFYGVVMCVGGLGFMGYLSLVSELLYTNWSPTYANIAVGVLSAIVDNIPVVFAVLSMQPVMDIQQWLLVTMTAGVGGSLLSVGSASGVALMGQTKGKYSFVGHLKWSWAIALGYIASIYVHFLING
ncbi:sodium:proton antiporter NhaD [Thalassotalea sp. 1_MG-2023]|uniref:sodium:proton antiporter NhaD n=1 Tax=Thalassotalea sp. 1_MG-2023 TaxID=3062680 RepID=UPI0026E14C9A|nr:sodium:proton antiporter NhaD [Thalassotalea sp. 1_MG-2023]MDO6428752.1 sodium:proton antiporter NhaD [Thalassotalea sp. 1_MG-2023]